MAKNYCVSLKSMKLAPHLLFVEDRSRSDIMDLLLAEPKDGLASNFFTPFF
jgi:hypothetical protein